MITENSVINTRYRLEKKIGQGGFAQVFLATDQLLKRKVAIKILNAELTEDDTFLARFEREAQSVAGLDHPNILTIHDFGHADETAYLVMPYIDGGTLHSKLRQQKWLDPQLANHYLKQAASALDYAHRRNIVHRDIKPQNMLIRSEDDRLLLADFGIAKVLGAASANSATGVMGTLSYMAPEQLNGTVGTTTDVYALGCVLFQMLTGQLPYSGTTEQVMMGHMMKPVPSILERAQGTLFLPPAVQDVIEKALAKRPEDRFRSTGELARAFEAVLSTGAYDAVHHPSGMPTGQHDTVVVSPTPTRPVTPNPTGPTPVPPISQPYPTPPLPQYARTQAAFTPAHPVEHTPAHGGNTPPPGVYTEPTPIPPPPPLSPKPGPNKALIGGIAGGVAVLIIAAILFVVLSSNNVTKTTTTPTVQAAATPTTAVTTAAVTTAVVTTANPTTAAVVVTTEAATATSAPTATPAPTATAGPSLVPFALITTQQNTPDDKGGVAQATSFTTGQEVFVALTYGQGRPNLDEVEITLVANGQAQTPKTAKIDKTDGILIVSLDKPGPGSYKVEVRYNGKLLDGVPAPEFSVADPATATSTPVPYVPPTQARQQPVQQPTPVPVQPTPVPVKPTPVPVQPTPPPNIPPTPKPR